MYKTFSKQYQTLNVKQTVSMMFSNQPLVPLTKNNIAPINIIVDGMKPILLNKTAYTDPIDIVPIIRNHGTRALNFSLFFLRRKLSTKRIALHRIISTPKDNGK